MKEPTLLEVEDLKTWFHTPTGVVHAPSPIAGR